MAIVVGILILVTLVLTVIGSYFIVGWFVRKCAGRRAPSPTAEVDADGNIVMVPKPLLWLFVPERTTGYIQRRGNDTQESGEGSKATPASGSGIIDMVHAVPGKILVRPDVNNPNEWYLRDIKTGEEETHRRGLFYYLYGVHWLGFFAELRLVRVREVRLSIDEEEMRKYRAALQKWTDSGRQGEKPHEPSYQEHIKSYNTYFPYFTREHDIVIRGSETAGAYTLDIYTKSVYEETYPIKTRTEVADPNATLSTFVEQSVTGETGAHEPEYYLFEKDASDQQIEGKSLRDRKKSLVETVIADVKDRAFNLIGITLKEFVVYAIDMDETQRMLLELAEKTDREEKARILQSEREIEVAKNKALAAIAQAEGEKQTRVLVAEGDAEALMLRNIAEGDRVAVVEGAYDRLRNGPALRKARAYESNTTVTTYTEVNGKEPSLLVGTSSK